MKRLPRQVKLAATPIVDHYSSEESEASEKENETSSGDFFKNIKKEVREDSPDSDFEEGSRKRKSAPTRQQPASKRIKLSFRQRGQASPEIPLPAVSDDEHEEDRVDDVALFEKVKRPLQQRTTTAGVKVTTLPNVLRIEVFSGPTTINLNLRDFLAPQAGREAADLDLDGRTLLEKSVEGSDAHSTHNERVATPEYFSEMRANPLYACFLELEPELRNRIYRDVLVKENPVSFNPTPDLSRTAAVLRTCRQVHREATDILYGENAFHLDRTDRRRGTLYTTWREVGYKDMRRFIETIGQDNLSKMRFLSISLEDAAQIDTPDLTPEQRRYYNDPVLYHIFKLIGNSNAVFEKLVVDFGGRGAVEIDNVPFVRAFTTMRCRKLIKTCRWHHSKINMLLFRKMEEFMKVPSPDNVNPNKQKAPKMQHELTERPYGCTSWSCGNRH